MRRLLLVLIILTPMLIFSQKNNYPTYTITGKIIDAATKKPLEDATIIFKSIDSNLIKFGGITNQKGNFSIDVEQETYRVSVEFISYETKILNLSAITRNFNLGVIELELDTEILNEVEIVGVKKTVEFKSNKIVFNVDKDVAANGGVATDILNNIPSVNVDPNGSITVQGHGSVQVMINGKISSLSKSDALKSLPAGSIEKIEVITNPGAKYDASALSVINIILKKGKDEGFNASLTATGGYKDYYGGLITLNNKSKYLNFFVNTSFNHSNPITTAASENEYFVNNVTSSFLNENSEFNSKKDAFYGTIGTDFYLSKNTTLSTSVNFQNVINKSNTLTSSSIFNAVKAPTATNDRTHIGKLENELYEFVVDFEHNFKKEGQQLTSSFLFSKDTDDIANTISNTNAAFTNQAYKEKNKLQNTSYEINFTSPIGKTSAYSVGYKGNISEVPFQYSSAVEDRNIDYSDNLNAVYVEFENEGEKFYYGLGLRAEFLELKADYLYLNTTQKNNFDKIFPTVYLKYTLSDSKSLSLSYSKKMNSPLYSQLQPFEQKYSETSSYVGNPALNPIYIDATNLGYMYNGNKMMFSSSLFFNRYNDYWEYVTYETGEQINGINKIITTPVNVGKLDYYGIDVTTIYKPAKILNFTGNINLYNLDQSGIFETVNSANETIVKDYNHASLNGSFSLLTQLKIPKIFDFQINAKHFLISKGAYSTRKEFTYASAAINKDFSNSDASISLTVDDIFKSNKTDRDRFDTNYFSKSLIENKYRTILLSFTYRFNQSKKDRKIDFDKKEIKPNY
ncbi:MAG: outer membrane beta-barrel family protein [Lutibacter sp.]|nr:outer membrane beta-barrel family protein [Lutibacter sp.]